MAWTDEDRQRAIEAYESAEPTPENSMEIVKQIAEEMDKNANGVRMILTKAEVYIKKAASASTSTSTSSDKPASKRVSKEDAQAVLVAAITDAGQEVDEDIVNKLTGKASVYLAGVINAINAS